jgi:hypothetical protein
MELDGVGARGMITFGFGRCDYFGYRRSCEPQLSRPLTTAKVATD